MTMLFMIVKIAVSVLVLGFSLMLLLSFLTDLSFGDILFKRKQTLPSWLTEIPVAHRGLHNHPKIPENTLTAFQKAAEQGFGIELDTHLTKDGVVVIHHDQNLKRMTGKDVTIKSLSLSELKKFRISETNERIPTLQEVLTLINGRVPVYVEIKNWTSPVGDLESKVYQVIQSYEGPLSVISFNPESVKWFRVNAPEILRGQTACGYLSEKDQHIPAFNRFFLKNFLLNWRSKPHFLVYELGHVGDNKLLNILKKFKTVLTYGAADGTLLKKAQAFSENYMFDHVSNLIRKIRS